MSFIQRHAWRVFAAGFGLWIGVGSVMLLLEGRHVGGAWLMLVPSLAACWVAAFGRVSVWENR